MSAPEERFKEMAAASKAAIEDFNDFAEDRAIAWAVDEISTLRLRVETAEKEVAEAYAKGQRDTITAVKDILDGVDREEMDHDGWWETSVGAEFGAKKLAEILALPSRRGRKCQVT